ncbi:uncharacterized protein LDX57_012473 [Aspergillus melleus]|uniref:uncharacterized protein n=1 Tax=Aspergillus melleus TaxID=138277 RepID=UPI001E8E3633|nr:uncharacterized protein LDX57_012473 [Aspergillus melleus]KAH8434842.1 hypothetical protein LDX57_012473 [Aspergillus melleus]
MKLLLFLIPFAILSVTLTLPEEAGEADSETTDNLSLDYIIKTNDSFLNLDLTPAKEPLGNAPRGECGSHLQLCFGDRVGRFITDVEPVDCHEDYPCQESGDPCWVHVGENGRWASCSTKYVED